MGRLQRVMMGVWARLTGVNPRRIAALTAAVAILCMTAGLPASGLPREHVEGERFGPIHWYETPREKKNPRLHGDFL